MTKTKRQLRAEAVERLRNLESSGVSYMPSDVLEKVTPFPNANIETLINLLTDDDEANPDASAFIGYMLKGDTFTGNMGEEADSRERLEADMREYFSHWMGGTSRTQAAIIGWLNRQAAITERECIDQHIADQIGSIWKDEKVRKLQAKVDELTAERDEYRDKFGKALDLAHEIGRLQP